MRDKAVSLLGRRSIEMAGQDARISIQMLEHDRIPLRNEGTRLYAAGEIYVVFSNGPPEGDAACRHIWTNATLGMKLHIGVDSQSGLAHSAVVTAANIHDKHPLPDLLHGNEQRVYGDSAYASQKTLIASKAPKARDFTNQRTRRAGGVVDEVERGKNRNKSKIRARVEHVFGVVKRLWGFGKVRYRGLNKNATRAFTALALANIYLARQRLMAQVRP